MSPSLRLSRVCASLALLSALISPFTLPSAHAQSTGSDTLVERAWAYDPQTKAFATRTRAAQELARAAHAERGEIAIDLGIGGMTMGSDMPPDWMFQAGISTELVDGQQRRAKAALAHAEQEIIACQSAFRALELRTEVESTLAEYQTLKQNEALLARREQQLLAFERYSQNQLQAGLSFGPALLQLQAELTKVALEQLQIETAVRNALQTLQQRIPELQEHELEGLHTWLETRPNVPVTPNDTEVSVKLLRANLRRMQEEQRLENASRRIRWSLGASYERSSMMAGHDALVTTHSLMAHVGIRIPNTQSANARSNALAFEQQALESEASALRLESARSWENTRVELQTQYRLLQTLEQRLEPLEQTLLQEQTRQLQSGKGNWKDLLDAYEAFNQLEQQRLQIQAQINQNLLALDFLSDGQVSARDALLAHCNAPNLDEVQP